MIMSKAQVGKRRRMVYEASDTEDNGIDYEVKRSRISEKSEVAAVTTLEHWPSFNGKGERMDGPKIRLCKNLVDMLMAHKFGSAFSQPVDPVKLRIPDYFDIIKNPMDLSTVKKKLASKQYVSTHDFMEDVRLTFANAMLYNPPENIFHLMAEKLNEMFNLRWKELKGKWRKENRLPVPEELPAKMMNVPVAFSSKSVVQKKRTDPVVQKKRTDPVVQKKRTETIVQKKVTEYAVQKKLAEPLVQKKPSEPVDRKRNAGPVVEKKLADSALRKTVAACSDSLAQKSLATVKASKPTQVIRKCATQGSRRASSEDIPSHPVAGSGCFFGRSISCTKEFIQISRDQLYGDSHELRGNALDCYSNHPSSPIASPGQGFSLGEGNHLYEEPLSPSKALRAAMLKSRFAATIVKAQQKALLDHGKKIDPTKLQLEKEKLEKRQLEEKARIEAQVKAAKAAAQKKVEDEIKMNREKEREAARLALQSMEKTVEIDNSDLLHDMEILSKKWHLNIRGTLLVDLADVIEPLPGLGSPLEQLGLFIKHDFDEELDDDMECCNSPTNIADVEEGEIS